jgi:hypothetical protein
MSDAILVAIIAAGASIIGQWLISRKQSQDKAIAEARRDERLELRLKAVEEKLDVHNGYAERFAEIGQDIAVIKTEVRALKRAQGE